MAYEKWDSKTTVKFAQQYKLHECLWNCNLNSYKDKHTRRTALMQIVDAMDIDGFGITEVKNKIKNLRSTYNQERRKLEIAQKNGCGPTKSNLRWYKHLDWIYKYNNECKNNTDNDEANVPVNNSNTDCSVEDVKPSRALKETQSWRKRQNNDLQKCMERMIKELKSLQESISNEADENLFDVFSKSVAAQLKSLPLEKALIAQSKIQNTLTELALESLREDNCTSPKLIKYSNPPTPNSTYSENCISEYQIDSPETIYETVLPNEDN